MREEIKNYIFEQTGLDNPRLVIVGKQRTPRHVRTIRFTLFGRTFGFGWGW